MLLRAWCHLTGDNSYGYGSGSVGVISLAEAVLRGTPSPEFVTIATIDCRDQENPGYVHFLLDGFSYGPENFHTNPP